MKNQKEIYEALLAGETLIMDKIFKVKLENGELYNPDTLDGAEYSFCFPDRWQICKEPKWYENISEGGVLCWLENGDNKEIVTVVGYDADLAYSYKFMLNDAKWCTEPTPLTKQEIQVFMDNAPETT